MKIICLGYMQKILFSNLSKQKARAKIDTSQQNIFYLQIPSYINISTEIPHKSFEYFREFSQFIIRLWQNIALDLTICPPNNFTAETKRFSSYINSSKKTCRN